tara:strand:- start:1568 stop:2608 length:1041 start_codon:yes stop_codon:yes gene_type:complete
MLNNIFQKIKSQKEIINISQRLKQQKKIVVTFNGSFDILHAGHALALNEAKIQGNILIVPLNSDKSVKSYKGPNRPIIPQKQRALQLAALECVDYVVLYNETNSIKILDKIKPNIHCNGSDWGLNCIEREVVEKNKGQIYILKFTKGLSTSNLIKKILQVYKAPVNKAVFIDRDGTLNYNEPEYLHKIKDFKFTPGSIQALRKLSKTDYKIIIITNQSGIARGYYKESDIKKLHTWLKKYLKEKGIKIYDIIYCPHHPDITGPCKCRKPGTAMIEKMRDKYQLSLNDSWIIGDTLNEIIAGRCMNMKTIMTKTRGIGPKEKESKKIGPQFRIKTLAKAIGIILKNK